MLVAKGVIYSTVILKNQNRFRHLANKIPIMGNKQNRSGIGAECRFQRFLRRNVHMVGRLIQNQEICLRKHQLGKGNTPTFSTTAFRNQFKNIILGK